MNNLQSHKSVLVLGNGASCFEAAQVISSAGLGVVLSVLRNFDPIKGFDRNGLIDLLMPAELTDFSGQPGCFKALFRLPDGSVRSVGHGCVVLALDCDWAPTLQIWGVYGHSKAASLAKVT